MYDALRRLAAQKMVQESPARRSRPRRCARGLPAARGSEKGQHWDSRGHFFAAAAEAMRRILDRQRSPKRRPKHGGDRNCASISTSRPLTEPHERDVLALDEALTRLAAEDREKAELVKLRYFAGFSVEEAAHLLGISAPMAKCTGLTRLVVCG